MQVDIADAQCCARSASGRSVVEALPRSAPKHKLPTGSTGAWRRRAFVRATHPQLIRVASLRIRDEMMKKFVEDSKSRSSTRLAGTCCCMQRRERAF